MNHHITIVANTLRVGGAERVALNLANGFSREDHNVDLVLVEKRGQLLKEVDREVDVINLGASRVLTSTPALRSYLQEQCPDVVISIGMHINIISTWAIMTIANDPVNIITEHSILKRMEDSFKKSGMRLLAQKFYPQADAVIAVSQGVKDDLRNLVNYDGEVHVIYNPIVSETLRHAATKPVAHSWFNEGKPPVVLSVGRLAPEKDVSTLLRAFALLTKKRDARLAIVGDGPKRESLQRLVKNLNIGGRVEFFGFVDNPYRYMANADVFVLTSENEGFGMVLAEALACGCPVVSTNCPSGPAEILEDGEYGPLVPVGDAEAMAEAIESTLSNPKEDGLLYNRASDFSIESSVSQYEDLINQIC